jgi:hypothetical protein
MKKQTRYRTVYGEVNGFVAIVYIFIMVVFITGYVKNIVKFVQSDFDAPYKSEVIHGAGIIAPPLGVIFGYCDFGK